jgi:hypothetical protein
MKQRKLWFLLTVLAIALSTLPPRPWVQAQPPAKGEVTLGGLKSYVERTVPFKVQLELGKKQKPFAIVEGYQAEELAVALAATPTVVANPPVTPTITPPAVRMSVAGVPLTAMNFTTVNTDARGNAVNQRQAQCWAMWKIWEEA